MLISWSDRESHEIVYSPIRKILNVGVEEQHSWIHGLESLWGKSWRGLILVSPRSYLIDIACASFTLDQHTHISLISFPLRFSNTGTRSIIYCLSERVAFTLSVVISSFKRHTNLTCMPIRHQLPLPFPMPGGQAGNGACACHISRPTRPIPS